MLTFHNPLLPFFFYSVFLLLVTGYLRVGGIEIRDWDGFVWVDFVAVRMGANVYTEWVQLGNWKTGRLGD
jgi:hypothetical protein